MEIEQLQEEISQLEKKWMDEYRPKITNSPRFVDNQEELQPEKDDQPKLDNTKLKPLYKNSQRNYTQTKVVIMMNLLSLKKNTKKVITLD